MNETTEKRRSFIISFCYFSIFVLLYYFFVNYALVYVMPFIIAALLGVWLQRPIRAIEKKTHGKGHSLISFVLVLAVLLVAGIILTLVGILLTNELKSFITFLSASVSDIAGLIDDVKAWLIDAARHLPAGIESKVIVSLEEFFDKYTGSSSGDVAQSFDLSVLLAPLAGAWNTAKRIPSLVLSFVVMVISCFFISSDYCRIRDGILSFMRPEARTRAISTKRTFFRAISKLAKAYSLIMLITFTEMFLGLSLLRVFGLYKGSYIVVISLIIAVVDIVPVLGTGTVVIPWAIYCLCTGSVGMGIGLIVIYAVVTVLRQIIEPKLVAGQVGLPAIVTIMAMFLGAKVFGAFGIIVLPLTVIVVKLLYDEGVFGNGENRDAVLSETAETPAEQGAKKLIDSIKDKLHSKKDNGDKTDK